eukprot:5794547-Alexandrium_andersonii.AAC.1
MAKAVSGMGECADHHLRMRPPSTSVFDHRVTQAEHCPITNPQARARKAENRAGAGLRAKLLVDHRRTQNTPDRHRTPPIATEHRTMLADCKRPEHDLFTRALNSVRTPPKILQYPALENLLDTKDRLRH